MRAADAFAGRAGIPSRASPPYAARRTRASRTDRVIDIGPML